MEHLITAAGDVHHIFPKEYLKQNGYNDKSLYNQVANYTYLDTTVNIAVGKKAPSDYFNQALSQCGTDKLTCGTIAEESVLGENLDANYIPHRITTMTSSDYPEFLKERRVLMAKKIRDYYEKL